ncbi:hypothetical protein OKW41_002722 [Paraburkholderia sp. UCT70]
MRSEPVIAAQVVARFARSIARLPPNIRAPIVDFSHSSNLRRPQSRRPSESTNQIPPVNPTAGPTLGFNRAIHLWAFFDQW